MGEGSIAALPPVVSADEWWVARNKLLRLEKEHTKRQDELAAMRRRMPMMPVATAYELKGPRGPANLLDLFAGRSQLIVYHFMFEPEWEAGCVGCSWAVDSMGHVAHLNARDVSLALVSVAPIAKLQAYKERMGWTLPWYSSAGTTFNSDFGVTTPEGEKFGLSVLLRKGEHAYRTYFTDGRGGENLGSPWSFLDLTPYGRQENWEDSPIGWPQTPPYGWWRRHDEYA